MDKKVIALITAVSVLVVGGFIVSVNMFKKDKPITDNTKSNTPIKTEVGTDADGKKIVVIGTDPDGVKIENGTYADGTKVEIATTKSGEAATETNGEYVIIYPTSPTPTNSSSQHNPSSENHSDSSTISSDGTSETNKTDTSENSTSETTSSKSSSSKTSSSKPVSSQTSSSKTSSSKPVSSSQTSSSKPSSSQTSSGEIVEPKTEKDTVSINGTDFKVGDTLRVSFYMQCDTKFTGVDLTVNYDSGILSALDNVEAPNVVSPESNVSLANRVRMIAVAAVAVNDFSTEKLLVSCDFKVKRITDNPSTIALQIEEMLDNDLNNISSENYTIKTEISKLS